MTLKPEVTVAAVAEVDGRFLFVEERISRKLVFNQPAGHVESGETLVQAVVRETQEETAWLFEPQALLGAYLWRKPASRHFTLRFAFIGGVRDHNPLQPLDKGIVRTHWLSRLQLVKYQRRLRSPLVLRCVDDYLAGRRLPLEEAACLDVDSARRVSAINL